MSPEEFWLEYDWRSETYKPAEPTGRGGITQADWNSARQRHKEKMNG